MATLYTRVRSRGGTLYTVTNTVKNAADSPFVLSANVRAADGTTTYEIFTESVELITSTPTSRTCINPAYSRSCVNPATDRTCS